MASIGLTDRGKKAAADLRTHGAGARLLRFLNNNGTSSIEEISEELNSSPSKVKRVAAMLYRKHYVERQ